VDLAARYESLSGRDLRWCHRCAGQLLTTLMLQGQPSCQYKVLFLRDR